MTFVQAPTRCYLTQLSSPATDVSTSPSRYLFYNPHLRKMYNLMTSSQDSLFNKYIDEFLNKVSGPYLSDIPGMELGAYKKKLLERFGNEAIGDQLARSVFLVYTRFYNCRLKFELKILAGK